MLPISIKGIIDKRIVAVGTSEKGYVDYEISIPARGGHSSAPPKHSGLGELAVAIQELEENQFKSKLLPFMKVLLDTIGRNGSFLVRFLFCNKWFIRPLAKFIMTRVDMAACMVRTTTAVTMAEGSPAENVLPQRASAKVNFRIMPGETIKDVEEHIREVTSNPKLEIAFVKGKEPSPFSPTDSRAYRCIEKLAMQDLPNGMMAPFLVMGGTDSSFYEPICENVYRFSPFKITGELFMCTHATNERIPVDSIGDAVAFFKGYVREMAQK